MTRVACRATLAVPEQGGIEIPMADIEFADSKLSFKIPVVKGLYQGTLANGALTGLWRQGEPPQPPAGFPAVLKKGDYVAKVIALKMPTESFGLISGTWKGDLHVTMPPGPNGPGGPVTIPGRPAV